MSTLALLVYAQQALPSPPEPTGSPDIDTVRVIGVVLVSLGIIALLAIAIKPFVVKSMRPDGPGAPDPELDPRFETQEPANPSSASSIIQFPTVATTESAGQTSSWEETDPIVADRFSRVVGESSRRRKLRDRQQERTPHDLAAAAMHRLGNDALVTGTTHRSSHATVVPFRGVANGTEGAERTAPGGTTAGPTLSPPSSIGSLSDPGDLATGVGVADDAQPEREHSAHSEVDTEIQEETLLAAHDYADEMPDPAVYLNGRTAQFMESLIADAPAETALDTPLPHSKTETKQTDELRLPADHDADRSLAGGHVAASQEVDTLTLAALHQVVRELLYCANSGQLLHGFALYSDPYLFRFMDGIGLSEKEFRETFGAIPARPRDEWDHLNLLTDVVLLPDGRIEATATYVDGNGLPSNGIERYRFLRVDSVWQIDDITPLDATP
jgi:hypothetical protein